MRSTIFAGLLALLAWPGFTNADAEKPKPRNPTEELSALLAPYDKAREDLQKALRAATTEEERRKAQEELGERASPEFYAERILELMRKHPKDEVNRLGLSWLLGHLPAAEQTKEAADLVARREIEDPNLLVVFSDLAMLLGSSDEDYDWAEGLVRAAIEKGSHRAVQGYARLSLARLLRRRADLLASGPRKARQTLEHEAEELYQQVIDSYADLAFRDDKLGKAAEADLYELRHLSVGKSAPDTEGRDLDGKPLKLSDFRGKVTLVVFWDIGCKPCMREVPHQRALVKKWEGRPFAVVGVDFDKDPEAARKVCAEKGMSWPSFWDYDEPWGPIAAKWNVQRWPTLYLIDAKGVIRFKGEYLRRSGVRDGKDGKPETYSFLDEAVESLLKEADDARP